MKGPFALRYRPHRKRMEPWGYSIMEVQKGEQCLITDKLGYPPTCWAPAVEHIDRNGPVMLSDRLTWYETLRLVFRKKL